MRTTSRDVTRSDRSNSVFLKEGASMLTEDKVDSAFDVAVAVVLVSYLGEDGVLVAMWGRSFNEGSSHKEQVQDTHPKNPEA